LSPFWGFIFVIFMVATIVFAVKKGAKDSNNNVDQQHLSAGLTAQAYALEALAKQGFSATANFTLEKGEKLIYQSHDIQLAEHKSAGSTYQGGNAGVSVPVGGGVRANLGGSSGSFIRNPAQLTVIDIGQVMFTTERVIFTGSQHTRVFDLDKVVNFEPGVNGLWVTISTTNANHTSVLQTEDLSVLAPGILLDIATTAKNEGEGEALNKVSEYAKIIRQTVAEQQGAKR
jgi:hypothetical protein